MHNISYVLKTRNGKDCQRSRLLKQAESFYQAGKKCISDLDKNSGEANLVMPTIVLWTFSLELYLKSILQAEKNENVRGHNVHDLFMQLKDETRNELIQAAVSKQIDLNKETKKLSGAFVSWRYSYENKNMMLLNFDVLGKLCQLFHNYIPTRQDLLPPQQPHVPCIHQNNDTK